MARPSAAGAMDDDLTAKARIRNAALRLFAERGIDGTAMRTVAAEAGVTVGLIVHHFGTKERLRQAVDLAVVGRFAAAIASVPLETRSPDRVAAARDEAVAAMLTDQPEVVDYLRRAILDGAAQRGDLVSRLSRLAAEQVGELRAAGAASTRHTVGEQVVAIMVRQLGRLFLQPLVDRIAEEFVADLGETPPRLVVDVTAG